MKEMAALVRIADLARGLHGPNALNAMQRERVEGEMRLALYHYRLLRSGDI